MFIHLMSIYKPFIHSFITSSVLGIMKPLVSKMDKVPEGNFGVPKELKSLVQGQTLSKYTCPWEASIGRPELALEARYCDKTSEKRRQ